MTESGEVGSRLEDCLRRRYRITGLRSVGQRQARAHDLDDYDGLPMTEFRQGYQTMSAPCKEFEALVIAGQIAHGNNPVAAWMSRNARVDQDAAGNIKLNKKKSRTRIDGILAAVMATWLLINPSPNVGAEAYLGEEGMGVWD